VIRICRGIAHIVTTKFVRLRTMGEGMDLRDVLRLDVDLGVVEMYDVNESSARDLGVVQ